MAKTYGNFTDFVDFSRSSGGTALRRVSYGPELAPSLENVAKVGDAASTITYNSGDGSLDIDAATTLDGAILNVPSIVVGRVYQMQATVTLGTSTDFRITVGPAYTTLASIKTSGVVILNFVAENTYVRMDTYADTGTLTVESLSVKEVTFDQSSGDLVLFNHPDDIPRVEYDANGVVKGLLIEEARTNRVLYSQDTSNWDEDGTTTITNSTQTAPDGTATATLIDIGSTGSSLGPNRISLAGSGFSASDTLTASVFLKVPSTSAADVVNVRMYCSGTTSTDAQVDFDTSDFTASFQSAAVSTVHSTEDYGNGWYRVAFTFTLDATATGGFNFRVGGTINGSATGTDIIMWGAQLEVGSFPTSYIPTSGATATRSADIASIATANFGYNKAAGTLVVDFDNLKFEAGGSRYPRPVEIGSSTNAGERINVYVGEITGNFAYGINTAGSSQAGATLVAANTSPLGPYKAGIAYKENDVAAVETGGDVLTDTSADISGVVYPRNTLQIGGSTVGTTNHINGHIKSLSYRPRRLTNAQLQKLTG